MRCLFEFQTIFHIVKRSDGKVLQSFHSESFFYLHIINQYEKDKHVVVDICCYKDPAMLECMYVESMKVNIIYPLNFENKFYLD